MFDVVIANPPYQYKKPTSSKSTAIWYKFVPVCFDAVKEEGWVAMIHPAGWRNIDGRFKRTQKLIRSKTIHHLNINDVKDGVRVFGASTRFDWWVGQNKAANGTKTKIIDQDNKTWFRVLDDKEFIPNGMFDEIVRVLA